MIIDALYVLIMCLKYVYINMYANSTRVKRTHPPTSKTLVTFLIQ